MAEQLTAADIEAALLRDIDAGRVRDDADHTPMLDLGGNEPARVAEMVWSLYQRSLVDQPLLSRRWQLTDAGRAVLEEADRG